MDNRTFEYISNLQYRLKNAREQLEAFKSGEKYVQMTKEHKSTVRQLENTIKKLKREITKAEKETVKVRNIWFEQSEIIEKEHQKEVEKLKKQLEEMEARALKAEAQRDEALNKVSEIRKEKYSVETELENEKGKNQKLTVQLNRNSQNSSNPSSKDNENKKKTISNSREKTDKKPGGQPGHEGHGRPKHEPTEPVIVLPAPQEVLDNPDFKKTGKTIIKQLVGIQVNVTVKQYEAEVYYNSKTGERVHAAFPEGVVNDVNYDGTVKAFLYLLNNDCQTSIDNCQEFLYDITDGQLNISKGLINNLNKEFSDKTKKERDEIYAKLLASPVMHTDCTNARQNGKKAYVYVCANTDGDVMYFARKKKGHKGVKDTPVETYTGTLVHDHESTFLKYGTAHQECLAHVLRYLKNSMENEPARTWNKDMHSLLHEMIHTVKTLDDGARCSDEQIADFEKRYDEILQTAKKEYEDVPSTKYYRDGYCLSLRMKKYAEHHLLFLHDPRVPYTNNEAERRLRYYKRKQKQAVSFRSQDSIEYYCNGMSMLVLMRKNNENVFKKVAEIFG